MSQTARRRYMDRFEAQDLAAGIYHSRQLPRTRYNNQNFLEYFSMSALEETQALLMEDHDTA